MREPTSCLLSITTNDPTSHMVASVPEHCRPVWPSPCQIQNVPQYCAHAGCLALEPTNRTALALSITNKLGSDGAGALCACLRAHPCL